MAKTSTLLILLLGLSLLLANTHVHADNDAVVEEEDDDVPVVSEVQEEFGGDDDAEEELANYEPPTPEGAHFFETFHNELDPETWVRSQQPKYNGVMRVQEPDAEYVGIKADKGLVIQKPNTFQGLTAVFNETLNVKDKSLVVQYEVKAQRAQECGGAYVKLLTAKDNFDPKKLDGDTPYTIMFGPDRCGPDNDKVHFIFRHQNPVNKEYEEKHVSKPPMSKLSDTLTHLYTLHVRPDNSFEVLVDGKVESSGSLLENFTPAVNPPKMIDDPTDKKPEDWVDEEYIDDPEAVKPEDWDETQPRKIPDPDAVKPDNWLDDEPAMIPDPSVAKPEDWDDEDDGEWEAPMVENPKCESQGCGEWKPPMIDNPRYKGPWKAPRIKNPEYKGEWKPRQIPNENYFEDNHPHNFDPMVAMALELWNVNDGLLFDNFFIGHDMAEARRFADATWRIKFGREKAKRATAEANTGNGKGFVASISEAFERLYTQLMDFVQENPQGAMVGAVMALLPLMIFLLMPSSSSPESAAVRAQPASEGAGVAAEGEDEDEEGEEEDEGKGKGKAKESEAAGTEGELEPSNKGASGASGSKVTQRKKKAKRAD